MCVLLSSLFKAILITTPDFLLLGIKCCLSVCQYMSRQQCQLSKSKEGKAQESNQSSIHRTRETI